MLDITENSIRKQLKTKVFGQKILYKEEIDSTNTEAKRQAFEDNHGLLVIAEEQSLGKGRRGRSWNSPKGTGIWMSLLLQPKKVLVQSAKEPFTSEFIEIKEELQQANKVLTAEKASMLTLITALSVAEAIREETNLEALIKWPNDIVINGRKVCGILTEMSTDNEGIRYVIIGIGINVNTTEFPEEIREIATSLWLEQKKAGTAGPNQWDIGKSKMLTQIEKGLNNKKKENDTALVDRASLVALILKKLELYYEQFLEEEDLGFLLEAYNKKLVNFGKEVKILGCNGQEENSGTAKGINKEGALLVETEEGLFEVRSGEVSVRGLYGYV